MGGISVSEAEQAREPSLADRRDRRVSGWFVRVRRRGRFDHGTQCRPRFFGDFLPDCIGIDHLDNQRPDSCRRHRALAAVQDADFAEIGSRIEDFDFNRATAGFLRQGNLATGDEEHGIARVTFAEDGLAVVKLSCLVSHNILRGARNADAFMLGMALVGNSKEGEVKKS